MTEIPEHLRKRAEQARVNAQAVEKAREASSSSSLKIPQHLLDRAIQRRKEQKATTKATTQATTAHTASNQVVKVPMGNAAKDYTISINTSGFQALVSKCDLCAAAVESENVTEHLQWHEKQDAIAAMVVKLAMDKIEASDLADLLDSLDDL